MSKILLDTNILLYAIDNNSPRQRQSQAILNADEYTLFTSSKNISELLCAATRGNQPILNVADTLRVVSYYHKITEILYADERAFQQLKVLLERYQPRGLKVHDYEIAAIALANGITHIATFNSKDFAGIEGLEIIIPE